MENHELMNKTSGDNENTHVNSKDKYGNATFPWKIIFAGVVVVIIIIALILGIYFGIQAGQSSHLGTEASPGLSCLQLKNQHNYAESRYYFIQVDGYESAFKVYCDMQTRGGGWTLVATIHQTSGNASHCTEDNRWTGNSSSNFSRNWENKEIFGYLSRATFEDYKSPAYFGLQASDVMLRHVPNNSSVLKSDQTRTLEYHTSNQFLKDKGGNLYSAFTNRYPLTPIQNPSVLEEMMTALVENGSDLYEDDLPPFYKYVYDDTPNELRNGGNDLFEPYGMRVSVITPACDLQGINYGQNYSICAGLSSRKSNPFFALLMTDSNDIVNRYSYKIDSHRSSSSHNFQSSLKSDPNQEKGLDYYAFCKYSDTIPSYCDFTFTVYKQEWNSTAYNSEVRYGSYPTHSNALFGYTMFAREPGRKGEEFPLNEIASHILDVISPFSTIDIPKMLDSLVQHADKIANFTLPEPYPYNYVDEPDLDRLANDQDLFSPYGMKLTALLPGAREYPVKYGQSIKYDDNLIELSSRKSFPFFALMKNNNPNLNRTIGFKVVEGRPFLDKSSTSIYSGDGLINGNFKLQYTALCSYNRTLPSVCNVFFFVNNEKDWKSQKVSLSIGSKTSFRDNNDTSRKHYVYRDLEDQLKYTNAIMGYTLLSRGPGLINTPFNLKKIMSRVLAIMTQFQFIGMSGLPCSNSNDNLVAPVEFTVGDKATLMKRIPEQFQVYTTPGFVQMRARTYFGEAYGMCPGVRVDTCEPQHVCLGKVAKSNADSTCNEYLNWPENNDVGVPDIRSNVMLFYR